MACTNRSRAAWPHPPRRHGQLHHSPPQGVACPALDKQHQTTTLDRSTQDKTTRLGRLFEPRNTHAHTHADTNNNHMLALHHAIRLQAANLGRHDALSTTKARARRSTEPGGHIATTLPKNPKARPPPPAGAPPPSKPAPAPRPSSGRPDSRQGQRFVGWGAAGSQRGSSQPTEMHTQPTRAHAPPKGGGGASGRPPPLAAITPGQ